jgi:hypothetical protein
MRALFGLLSVCVFVSFAGSAAQESTSRPVATIRQLHDAMISPASDVIFDVGREAPKDDQAWALVRNSAVVLAESGNLLMLEGRARDKGEWMKLSRALGDAGAAALKAADARSTDALLAAGDEIVPVCEGCHKPYRDNGRTMGPPAR